MSRVWFQFPFLLYFSLCARADWDGTCFLLTLICPSISTCVARLLCLIIMFCSHSASSALRSIAVTLCFDKNSPVWSGRVLSSVWPYLCPVSQLSAASGPFASGCSPPDCTAFSGRDCTSSHSSQVCYCVPVFFPEIFLLFCVCLSG